MIYIKDFLFKLKKNYYNFLKLLIKILDNSLIIFNYHEFIHLIYFKNFNLNFNFIKIFTDNFDLKLNYFSINFNYFKFMQFDYKLYRFKLLYHNFIFMANFY